MRMHRGPVWIPVAERKPEAPCIVCDGYNNVRLIHDVVSVFTVSGTLYHFSGDLFPANPNRTRIDMICEANAITHWMPLPETPSKEGDSNRTC